MTIAVATCGFLAGSIVGTFVAWGKIGGNAPVRWLADGYTTVLRGIPDLLVIYLFYFGGSAALGAIGSLFGAQGFIGVPAFVTGALAIGIVSGAYQAEVFRGAYQVVSRGELEAARHSGRKLDIQVLGLASIAADVTPELARAAIGSVTVLGALHASAVVKAALADRLR